MYPLGVLFGLGFDTATEVALLLIAAGAAGAGLPIYAILCLPVLFAAGMSLLDTADGAFMNVAYGWALAQPARKAYYNLTVTGLSVVVALGVGGAELLGVLGATQVDLNVVGYVVTGLFVLTWVAALAIWRYARIEERLLSAGP
jgi:high-affinity nickel-transport protein